MNRDRTFLVMREALQDIFTLLDNGSLTVSYGDRRATEDDLSRIRALLERIDGTPTKRNRLSELTGADTPEPELGE